jgi:hypothetical protein
MTKHLAALLLIFGAVCHAQSNPTYIPFTPAATKGALYKPDSGPAPHVAVLIIHRTGNFMVHLGTTELAKRGFLVLGMNPRSDNNEAAVHFEDNALDIKAGIEFLRKQPGIRKVVLFGHSGGGPATSFYQAVAEKGIAYCQAPEKLVQCGQSLANVPPADGIVFVDAHPGVSVNGLRSINPAVINEADPKHVDAGLDPFNPQNGYDPKGASHYSPEFQAKYFKAQADRMSRLIQTALKRQREIGGDDDVFLVPRGEGARLMELDPSIHHTTAKPQKLLRDDGTVATQIVESVRPVGRGSEKDNASFERGTRMLTLKSFLSANAVRATNSMDGIDWCSSNNSTPCAVRNITVPVLFTAMGAHYFIRDNEIHFEMSGSKDKDFIVVEGATHGIRPCIACEKTPGQYSNTVKNFFDYVAKWINDRY